MIQPVGGGDRAAGIELPQNQAPIALASAPGDAHRLLEAAVEHIGGDKEPIQGLLPELEAPHLRLVGIGLTVKHPQPVAPLDALLVDEHHQVGGWRGHVGGGVCQGQLGPTEGEEEP